MKSLPCVATLCIVMLSKTLFAQYAKEYVPIRVADSVPVAVQEQFDQNLENQNKAYLSRSKKDIFFKERNALRNERILWSMKNGDVYYNGPIYDYLNRILEGILAANGKEKNIRLYPVKFNAPNACSWGDGTLFFNIGLLSRLENDDQVASVLCHELAHYYNGHMAKAMDKYYTFISDKELQKEVKRISKEEFNQNKQLDSLTKMLNFQFMFHSRESEQDADTTGLQLLLKTKYSPYAAVRSMEILDSCDKNKFKDSIQLKELFTFPDFAFKDRWLSYEMSDMWHDNGDDLEFANSDTLKSHPDCKKRKEYLQAILASKNIGKATDAAITGNIAFNQLTQMADFEMVEADFQHQNYGKALFRTLLLLKFYPDNLYLHSMVCTNLYYLYKYRKNHHSSEVITQPFGGFEKHYNDYLGFMQQLGLNDMCNICNNYAKMHLEGQVGDENQAYALLLTKAMVAGTDMQSLAQEFIKKYPATKSANWAKTEFIPVLVDDKKDKKHK